MRTILKCALTLAVSSIALFGAKPDFSGDWSLNADKSNLGPMPAPQSMTRKIEHADPSLTMTQATVGGPQGDQTFTFKVSTDGKETTNQLMGNPAKTTAKWDGDTLVITVSLDFQGTEIKLIEKWSLGDDGKTLTDNTHFVAPQGEFDIVYVMNKK